MSGNIPYIGSKISLITTSDIRYEGILYMLNREESTIAVQNVRSFGTEGRRCPEVPMSNEIYDFIIFRGKDLKNLTVLQGAPERVPSAACPDYPDPHGGSLYSHPAPLADPYGFQQPAPHADLYGFQQPAPHADPYGFQQPAPHVAMAPPVFQRPSLGSTAPARNGFAPAPAPPAVSPYAPAYPSAASSAGRPAEKAFGGSAHSRQSYSPVEPRAPPLGPPEARPALYEEASGVASSRGTSEEAKPLAPRVAADSKERGGEPKADPKARGRGKGGGQKKQLFEVLRYHKRAEEAIVKAMRGQSSPSLPPTELRAMSEVNPAVYHFYLDFVNYCCPSHMVQSDEQQWESLCKALKKHFEKEFGASQNQKPPQPQRPNNTLGDFITIETNSKAAKKNAKAARGGGRVGRGSGRGDSKEADGQNSGELDGAGSLEDSSSQSTTWVCPRCTLRNENLLLECAACGTSKQQAALWAEFPPLG